MNNGWGPITPPPPASDDTGTWLAIGDLMAGAMAFFMVLFLAFAAQLHTQQEETKSLRRKITLAVLEELEAVEIEATEGNDGEIIIRDDVMFRRGRSTIRPEYRKKIQQIAPAIARVLASHEDYAREVDRIILEGHTDRVDDETFNLTLSLNRARAVALAIVSDESLYDAPEHLTLIKERLYPSGRGEWSANQHIDDDADRRVIFRLQWREMRFFSDDVQAAEALLKAARP